MVLFIITGNIFSTDRTLAVNRSDSELQRPIEYRNVPQRRNYDRTLAASDQLIVALTVGMTGRVRSGRDQRPIRAEKQDFVPNGYFLSGAYKYNPQPAI